jgi:hypothetical protein
VGGTILVMSEEYLAGVGLRVTQVATRSGVDGNALTNLNAAEHPNGALALVAADNTLYSLDKSSTATPDGIAIIAAIGGGNWIALTSGDQVLYSVESRLFVATGEPNSGPVVQNTWRSLPGAALQYALGFGAASPLWGINTTTGVLTYSGPQRQFIILGSITMSTEAGNQAFSFSHSAAPIIGTTNDSDFENQYTVVAGNNDIHLSFIGAASVAAGQTIEGAIRNLAGVASMTIRRYQLAIIPAS